MKKFIFKILLFFVPIIAIGIGLEVFLRQIPNQYTLKKKYLTLHPDKVESLILGSSHTYYGINPEYFTKPCFNAANISQSLDLDFELLKNYIESLTNIKTVILPISYFSLFEKLDEGDESWRIKNYTIYFDLDLSNELTENSEVLSINLSDNISRIYSYYITEKYNVDSSKFGWGNSYKANESLDLEETGISSSKRHTIDDLKLLDENLSTLKSIIELCSKKNINLLLFTPPAYKSYYQNLDKKQLDITINSANKLASSNKNCMYINLLKDSLFNKLDFYDADHLNTIGAKKLSILLNKLISN